MKQLAFSPWWFRDILPEGINITRHYLSPDLMIITGIPIGGISIFWQSFGIFDDRYQRRERFCDTKKWSLVRNAKFLDWISKCTITCNDWCRHEVHNFCKVEILYTSHCVMHTSPRTWQWIRYIVGSYLLKLLSFNERYGTWPGKSSILQEAGRD